VAFAGLISDSNLFRRGDSSFRSSDLPNSVSYGLNFPKMSPVPEEVKDFQERPKEVVRKLVLKEIPCASRRCFIPRDARIFHETPDRVIYANRVTGPSVRSTVHRAGAKWLAKYNG